MRECQSQGAIYKIDSCVGQGRTAVVYRAVREDRRGHSRQTVALKVLKSGTAVPWLRREFETLALVSSPHCVRVLAWENLDEGCALVLEWIDGITLHELAGAQSIPPELVKEIVAQIQSGLVAVRSSGLHHGDLSPVNVLIDRQGTVRIVDFATAAPEEGYIHGTPAYLSPEIWNGAASSFEGDLFALGLMEMDLQTGLLQVPNETLACQKRALKAASSGSLLLRLSPVERRLTKYASDEASKQALGALVRRQMDGISPAVIETVRMERPSDKASRWNLNRTAGLLLMGIASATAVSAQAPQAFSEKRASLTVASQQWLKLEINGRDAGYAPLKIESLQPGMHRVRWQSASGGGEIKIQLSPGQSARLTLTDRLRLDAAGNR